MSDSHEVQLPEVPGVGRLIAQAISHPRRPDPQLGLPQRWVSVSEVKQPVDRLAAYDRLCGFSVRDAVPATWLHVLTFPLQAYLMAQADFPFPLAGILHVSNEMTQRRPVSVGEKLRLEVRAENARPHARGVVFDLVGTVLVGTEEVWRGVSTYLSGTSTLPGEPAATLRLEVPDGVVSQQWRLPADLGRRYAVVSGDTNPIHLHPLSARLFGLPRPIIHGMWTHARALAALGGVLPDAYSVQVQFAKPLMLPGRVDFLASTGGEAQSGAAEFAVLNKQGKPHLVGRLTPTS